MQVYTSRRKLPDGSPHELKYPERLANWDVELSPSGIRFAIRDALCDMAVSHRMSSEDTARYIVTASLMFCWSSARSKPGTGLPPYRNDLIDYGALCWDFLREHGASVNEIIAAGNAALQMLIDAAVSAEDLVEAQGKSKAPEGTGSGRSSP